MKKLILILLFCTACHAPTSIQTQQGKIAYSADMIVIRVNELESAAIQANAGNALDVNTTRTIVEFCVGADTILKQTPSGWLATVTTLWQTAKAKITTTNPAILASESAVDVALGLSTGGQ